MCDTVAIQFKQKVPLYKDVSCPVPWSGPTVLQDTWVRRLKGAFCGRKGLWLFTESGAALGNSLVVRGKVAG